MLKVHFSHYNIIIGLSSYILLDQFDQNMDSYDIILYYVAGGYYLCRHETIKRHHNSHQGCAWETQEVVTLTAERSKITMDGLTLLLLIILLRMEENIKLI